MALPEPERIEATILALLRRRAPGSTICPSEAARALARDGDFQALMDPVRAQAWAMVERGALEITQRAVPAHRDTVRGPIRLRLPRLTS